MKSKSKKQNIYIGICLVLFMSLTGCSNDSDKKDTKQKNDIATKSVSAPKIEIVENKNAKEIKVKAKARDKNQSNSYYYSYNSDSGVNKKQKTVIDANLNIRSPYDEVKVSLLVRKLSKKFIIKCSACHNDYANGIIGPSLLGRNSDYIYNAIAKFKNGQKKNVLMTDLINMMNDEEIRKLADEIYQFNQEINKIRK